MNLSKLRFKSDNIIKLKAIKNIVKKNCSITSKDFRLILLHIVSLVKRIVSLAKKLLPTKVLMLEEQNKIE